MSTNLYFDFAELDRFVRYDTVRAADVNTAFDLVTAGFDLLPTPAKLAGGYANYAAATGSVNAFVVSLSAQITSLVDGLEVKFKANASNTGAATLNVNGLGAKTIVRPGGTTMEASDIPSGHIATVHYDATNDRFELASLSTGDVAPTTVYSGTAGATIDLLTGANIASASTVNLNSATGNLVHITGTTTITAVTLTRGPRSVIFDGSLTLTHHATNNNLPGGANITTAAGDKAEYWSDGTTVYCLRYTRAAAIPFNGPLVYEARTSNTIIGKADHGKLIDITSGTFTQTWDTAANLGATFYTEIRNSGTGEITTTLDGVTFIMYPGEHRAVFYKAAALASKVLKSFLLDAVTSADFTKPPGYLAFMGLLWGGGGGGGRNNANQEVGGGGGGACVPFHYLTGDLSATEAFVIGAAGTAQTGVGVGGTGGTSTFKRTTAYGGAGGGANGAADHGGGGGGGAYSAGTAGAATAVNGGTPRNGTAPVDNYGFGGGDGGLSAAGTKSIWGGGGGGGAAVGGASLYGGGGGGGVSKGGSPAGFAGGQSSYGGNGSTGSVSGNGTDGVAPGGGGGGTRTGTTSGAGAKGQLRIWGIT